MKALALGLVFTLLLLLPMSLAADQKTPVFYFGGNRLFVGMPKSEAVALLLACCKLSPPADSENKKLSADTNRMIGHFIFPKEESPQRILGTIYFADGKVSRITRPLDAEKFDPESDDIVAFTRALDRNLAPETGDSRSVVFVSSRHERLTNGEGEILSFSFPNGRAIELQIVTLDTPSKITGRRDSVGLDEILEPPRQQGND